MLPPIDRRTGRAVCGALLLALSGPAAAQPGANQPRAGDRVRTVGDTLPGAVGGVAVDRLGIIYAADFGERVFKIWPDGRTSVFATGLYGSSGNAIDADGQLFQSNFHGNSISRITRDGTVSVFAEGLQGPVGVAVAPDGHLYVCNCRSNTLSRVSPNGEVSAFAASDLFACPNGITRAPDGTLYVVNFGDTRMLKVTPNGEVSEFAQLPGGGNGHVTMARGALYATSFQGHRIYRVTLDGEVTLIAGTGAIGEGNGPALEATFTFPNGIAAGPTGDRLYVNDFLNRFPPTLEAPPAPRSIIRQITFASFSSVLVAALAEGGVEAMAGAYREWKTDPSTAALFTEREVNALGYQLMGSGRVREAIRLFTLNVESYPQSFNVYDSLAEAYLNAGEHDRAIELYRKSLEINPANTNATAMIARIREQGR